MLRDFRGPQVLAVKEPYRLIVLGFETGSFTVIVSTRSYEYLRCLQGLKYVPLVIRMFTFGIP
jgi:hypothetical protein